MHRKRNSYNNSVVDKNNKIQCPNLTIWLQIYWIFKNKLFFKVWDKNAIKQKKKKLLKDIFYRHFIYPIKIEFKINILSIQACYRIMVKSLFWKSLLMSSTFTR